MSSAWQHINEFASSHGALFDFLDKLWTYYHQSLLIQPWYISLALTREPSSPPPAVAQVAAAVAVVEANLSWGMDKISPIIELELLSAWEYDCSCSWLTSWWVASLIVRNVYWRETHFVTYRFLSFYGLCMYWACMWVQTCNVCCLKLVVNMKLVVWLWSDVCIIIDGLSCVT
jgi:hypothetical protein